jgi:hypothetical protein
MESKRFNFFKPNPHIAAIEKSLQKVSLTENLRESLTARYITLLHDYYTRKKRYSCSFHLLRTIVTVGSLIVPSVLSVQYTSGNVTEQGAMLSSEVYWIVWTLSLFVTISNGIMSLLKMDKKYHSLHTTFEQLLSEGWQYVHLSGKYFTEGVNPSTHETQFPIFCFYIEKVRMKQIEDEYYKTVEQGSSNSEIAPKTPWRNPFPQEQKESSTHQVNEATSVTFQSNAKTSKA